MQLMSNCTALLELPRSRVAARVFVGFVVEGNYKYKYYNGYIAMSDTQGAWMNFVNALEKIPGIIAQYEERTVKLKADVPQLEAIISKTWGKEDELIVFRY